MKYLAALAITILCILIALIPEGAMYLIFRLANPTTELGRILLIGIFLVVGGGLIVWWTILVFVLWGKMICAVMDW